MFVQRCRFILLQYNYQYAQHREAHERKLLADGNNGDGIREYVGLATRTCPVLENFIAPCMSRMKAATGCLLPFIEQTGRSGGYADSPLSGELGKKSGRFAKIRLVQKLLLGWMRIEPSG